MKGVAVTLVCGPGANKREVLGVVGVVAGRIDERTTNVVRMPVDGVPHVLATCSKHGTFIVSGDAGVGAGCVSAFGGRAIPRGRPVGL